MFAMTQSVVPVKASRKTGVMKANVAECDVLVKSDCDMEARSMAIGWRSRYTTVDIDDGKSDHCKAVVWKRLFPPTANPIRVMARSARVGRRRDVAPTIVLRRM